jgi:hypothetical protein
MAMGWLRPSQASQPPPRPNLEKKRLPSGGGGTTPKAMDSKMKIHNPVQVENMEKLTKTSYFGEDIVNLML